MANALISRQRVVAVKTESTAGTAVSLANADGAMNCYDAAYTPEVSMSERPSQGTYDADLTAVPGARMGRISYRTDYFGGETSALWFARTLIHGGFTVSSSVATAVGSASTSTATVGAYVDGLYHQIAGAVVSSIQWDFESGQAVYMAVEYVGKYSTPTDVTILTPTYPSTLPGTFRGTSGGLTWNSSHLPVFSGSIRVENQVAMRPDPTDASGYLHAQITRQTITAELSVESALVATRADYTNLTAAGPQTMIFDIQTGDASLSIPGMQYMNVQPGDNEGIYSHALSFKHTGSSAATLTII